MKGKGLAFILGAVVGAAVTMALVPHAKSSDSSALRAKKSFLATPGSVVATGSWWSPDIPRGKWPTGAVSITCLKSAGICTTTRSMMPIGGAKDDRVETDTFIQNVQAWSETQVVIAAEETACAATHKTIDLVTQRVMMRVRKKGPDCKPGEAYSQEFSVELGEAPPP